MDALELRTLFGWCLAVNTTLLAISAGAILLIPETVQRLHRSAFGLGDTELTNGYFWYLAGYKLLIVVFNLVPFLALSWMR